jgi:hypothetical protein
VRKDNYKGEKYSVVGEQLLERLESISIELRTNLLSNDKSFLVAHIIKERNFNSVFIGVSPNYLEHKYYKNEHNGLYAFAIVQKRNVDFQYIGISKTIKKRFGDHVKSKAKNNANWAYLMAQHTGDLNPIMKIPAKQLEIHGMRFTFIHIDNPNLRLMAEVYCANKFRSFWNSFDTH